MTTHLNWKNGIFSNTCNIYSDSSIIGTLKNKIFSSQVEGEINGEEYLFVKKSAFKSEIQIIDRQNNTQIGSISYNAWNTKAKLSIGDEIVHWKYDNVWQTKWSISSSDRSLANYKGNEIKGVIETAIDDNLLILSGLYVTNYFWKSGFAFIFLILMITIF